MTPWYLSSLSEVSAFLRIQWNSFESNRDILGNFQVHLLLVLLFNAWATSLSLWLQGCSCDPNPFPACFCATPPLLLSCATGTAVQFLLISRDLFSRAAARAGPNWSLLARLNHLQTGTVHKDRINRISDHSTDLVYVGALSSFLTSVTHLPWIKRLHNPRDWESKDIRNVLWINLVFEMLCCNYLKTKGLRRVLCTILKWPSHYSFPVLYPVLMQCI